MEEKPTIFIPFGATGDLMRIKVLPALFELFTAGALPKNFRVIGVSHRSMDAPGFRAHVREMIEIHAGKKIPDPEILPFLSLFEFVRGEFDDESVYTLLSQKIAAIEKEFETSANKLFYFAIAPHFYEKVAAALYKAKLNTPSNEEAWTRLIIEKPFGLTAESARTLEALLSGIFSEEQLYRTDHYLAKKALQHLPRFNPKEVKSISIRLLEDIGVEKRGASYDILGTLRDVGQNHVLEILALLTMNAPENDSAEEVRRARREALDTLPILSKHDIEKNTMRAQYEGYQAIAGVSPNSQTETYFKISTALTSPLWKGIPVLLEAGKRRGDPHKEVLVLFHNTAPLSVRLESRTHYTEEYMRLILDAISGDQKLFMSKEEVAATWRFVDPILRAWEDNAVPLLSYKPDTKEVTT